MARWRRRSGASATAGSSCWTRRWTTRGTISALKPVYLPLVHQLVQVSRRATSRRRRGRRSARWWISSVAAQEPRRSRRRHAGGRARRRGAPATPGLARADRAGRLRNPARPARRPARPERIAVNLDPAESDLTPIDPRELVAAVTGRATPMATARRRAGRACRRRTPRKRQGLWWYLLLGRPAAPRRRNGRVQPAVAQGEVPLKSAICRPAVGGLRLSRARGRIYGGLRNALRGVFSRLGRGPTCLTDSAGPTVVWSSSTSSTGCATAGA